MMTMVMKVNDLTLSKEKRQCKRQRQRQIKDMSEDDDKWSEEGIGRME